MTDFAGYIVADNEAIHGMGATADAAWDDFVTAMSENGTIIIGENDDSTTVESGMNWCRETNFRVLPATYGLLKAVHRCGGNIAFVVRSGVAGLAD